MTPYTPAGALDRALDHVARSLHARDRVRRHLDALAAARDAHDIGERQRSPSRITLIAASMSGVARPAAVTPFDQERLPRREAYDGRRCCARSRPRAGRSIGPPGWRFFSFWLALAITNLGTWAGVVALQLRILDLTGDQAYVSAIVVAEYLPAVVLGTVLGHLLDRVPPRSGLAACELLAAAAWALMVTTGRAGAIVALALICGVTTGIFKIVSTAVVPMLVDDDELDAANGSILTCRDAHEHRAASRSAARSSGSRPPTTCCC